MNLKVLILGGTRLLGKSIVEKFLESKNFDLYVLSRKASIYKGKCHVIEEERSNGITKLINIDFDLIIDLIAYDQNAVKELTEKLHFKKYIFISSCWMTKLNKAYQADDLIDLVDKEALEKLPVVTQTYLLNKRSAENYLWTNLTKNTCHIIRLPIFWGENDHTKRLDFYVSRFLDKQPVILVNSGNNVCQIAEVNDLANALVMLFQSDVLNNKPLLEALPTESKTLNEIVNTIGKALGSSSPLVNVSAEILEKKLSEYLDAEPLWREDKIELTKNNIYTLLKIKSEIAELWLQKLAIKTADLKPDTNSNRSAELQFISSAIK